MKFIFVAIFLFAAVLVNAGKVEFANPECPKWV